MDNKCFFWIASGTQYVGEAIGSAYEAATHMPEVRRVLFSPERCDSKVFTETVKLPEREDEWYYIDFVRYVKSAADTLTKWELWDSVLLDTDVHILDAVPELFDLLSIFDMFGAYAPGRKTTNWLCQPRNLAFPEINTGILGMNLRFTPVHDLLSLWRDNYVLNRAHYENNDQGPFHDALLSSPHVKFHVLPPEYHVRTICGGFAGSEVKILHGRLPDVNRAKDHVNQSGGMRIWGPFGE